jgi:hypothetical protein
MPQAFLPDFVSAQSRFLGRVGNPIHPSVDPCSTSCAVVGPSPRNQTASRSFDQLQSCQYTLFYEFSFSDGPIDDPGTPHPIYACTAHGTDWAALRLPIEVLDVNSICIYGQLVILVPSPELSAGRQT